MKKKPNSRILHILGQIINLRAWFDWDRMKAMTRYLIAGIKKFFVPQQSKNSETFEAAKKRLSLTDNDLLMRQKGLLRVSLLMVVVAFFLFCYAVYHFYHVQLKGGFVSLVVMLIALVLAFRYHFWYFQIKKRKLGCTMREWFRQGLMGDKQ